MSVSHVHVPLRRRETGREKEVASSLETSQITQTKFIKPHTANPALKTTLASSLLLDWVSISEPSPRALAPRALAHSRPSGSFSGNNERNKGTLSFCQQIPATINTQTLHKTNCHQTRNVFENIFSPLRGNMHVPRHKGFSQWGQHSNGGTPGRGGF